MSALPLPVVLALAATCQHMVAPATIAGIARHESAFDPQAVHRNADGSTDAGLMQINSANWAWLGLTAETALDPCQSIRAASFLLASYSRFNTGSPTAGIANGYATAVQASVETVKLPAPPQAEAPPCPKTRTYALMVDTKPVDQAAVSFAFTYPTDDAAAKAAQWRQNAADREQKAAKAALYAASGAGDSNVRYALQGKEPADWDLLPTREVSDNGTDTHFHFPGAMRVPIIYAVNPDGKEAVVEPTFNSQTGVATVHQLARVFHLRDGDALLCVFNRSYDPVGIRSATGTISPDVDRVTR